MVLATTNSAAAWRPDVTAISPEDILEDALILSESTVSGTIEGDEPVVRVGYIDDAEATITLEGDEIDEAAPDLAEVEVATDKLTQYFTLSREQYGRQQVPAQLAASMARGLTRKADSLFLFKQPTATNGIPGLLNYADIVGGAGDTTTPAIVGSLDPLIDLVAQLEANGATPSAIILDPMGWGALRKLKTGDGSNTSILGAGTTDAARLLLDLPVKVNKAMPANTGLVIDSTAIASAVGDVKIAASEHAAFKRDSIALRATWRIGFTPVRPERLGTFTIGA